MTTNPISPTPQPRDPAGKFGTKHLSEVPPLDLADERAQAELAVERARENAEMLWAHVAKPTGAQTIEAKWSANPRPLSMPSVSVPLDCEVVQNGRDEATCPLCAGTGSTPAGLDEVTCYLCDGSKEVDLKTAKGFVADVRKTFRPDRSEPDYAGIIEDRAQARGGYSAEALEWGGIN